MIRQALGSAALLLAVGCLTTHELDDTWSPDVVILSPADGSVLSSSSPVTVCAHIFDEDAIEALTVEFESDIDGPFTPSWDLCPGGNFGADLAAVSAGEHVLTLRATDRAGNRAEASVSVSVVDGNTPPTCLISLPVEAATFTVGDSIPFEATVTDNEQSAETLIASIDSDIDGTIWSGSADTLGTISTSLQLSSGTHAVTLLVTDNASQTISCGVQVTVIE